MRLVQQSLAALLCPADATISNLLRTAGQGDKDWSASYRCHSRGRVDGRLMLDGALQEVEKSLPQDEPLVLCVDDTLVKKSGKKVDGARWRRDSLGPKFHTNFVMAQRFLQMSASWPLASGEAKTIPVALEHTPGTGKVCKKATLEEKLEHRQRSQTLAIGRCAGVMVSKLQEKIPSQRKLFVCADGGFANASFVSELPENVSVVLRIRKDSLFHLPPTQEELSQCRGRRLLYGKKLQTPEAMRQDDLLPWTTLCAYAVGKFHDFQVKVQRSLQWRTAKTAHKTYTLIIVKPLSYRLSKHHRTLYRKEAYILTDDNSSPLQDILQYYLWRWGIEVNFRDQKTLLGMGEARLRTPASCQSVPATIVAAYSALLISSLRLLARGHPIHPLPPAKWQHSYIRKNDLSLPSTCRLLGILRYQCWSASLSDNDPFSHFVKPSSLKSKPQKASALLAKLASFAA